jgi:hypothetical protein
VKAHPDHLRSRDDAGESHGELLPLLLWIVSPFELLSVRVTKYCPGGSVTSELVYHCCPLVRRGPFDQFVKHRNSGHTD